jgi:isopenicillin N synthase-like dioxygenase
MPPPFKNNPEASESIKRFYQACHDVSERLMELFALALEARTLVGKRRLFSCE